MFFWLVIFELMVLLQVLLAWRECFLTPAQMLRVTSQGLPFSGHGGMWGDFFLISVLCAVIIRTYGAEWARLDLSVAALVGLAVSYAMHESYKRGECLEAHVRYGRLTAVGWVHFVYMAAALAVIGLYYVLAPYTPLMWLVSGLLILHTVAGTHVLLGIVRPTWYPGRPLQNPQTWAAIAGVAVITLGSSAIRAHMNS